MTRRAADDHEIDAGDTDATTGRGARSSSQRRGLTTAGWAAKGRLDVWHRVGAVVLGMVLLIGAAVCGGRVASTVTVTVGAAFLRRAEDRVEKWRTATDS